MLTTFIFLSAVVICSGFEIQTWLLNDSECKGRGVQCSADLSKVIYCTNANASYVLRTCNAPEVCMEESSVCGRGSGGEVEPFKNVTFPFTCTGEGVFPDAYWCNIGYLCSGAGKDPDQKCECPSGEVLTVFPNFECSSSKDIYESCSCKYKDRCSDDQSPGTFGPGCHYGFYYTCNYDPKSGFISLVHKCPGNQFFFDGKCRDPPSTIQVGEMEKTTRKLPLCKPIGPEKCVADPNVKCKEYGELIAHSEKKCYYYCDSNLKPILMECPENSSFDCVYGQCGCT